MGWLTKVADFVGGSLFKEIKEGVLAYFPPDMTPQQKAELELKVQQLLHEKELEANRIIEQSAAALDKRIAEQEGRAEDLLQLGWFGKLMIGLRGVQRPTWGFATLAMDWQWFFGTYDFDEQQSQALLVINFLVLGFLFGERTLMKLEPLLVKVFAR
jgi:hypothetical protein